MGDLTGLGAEIVAELQLEGDYLATTDPRQAANNRPCFLIAPPVLDWTGPGGGTLDGTPGGTVRVLVLSGHSTWTDDTLAELEPLLEHAVAAIKPDRAEPSVYSLGRDVAAVPCLVLTLTL